MTTEQQPKITAEQIARMVNSPLISTEQIARRIHTQWEPIKNEETLEQCLDEVADEYARTIAAEVAFDERRKMPATVVEVIRRIRQIPEEG